MVTESETLKKELASNEITFYFTGMALNQWVVFRKDHHSLPPQIWHFMGRPSLFNMRIQIQAITKIHTVG